MKPGDSVTKRNTGQNVRTSYYRANPIGGEDVIFADTIALGVPRKNKIVCKDKHSDARKDFGPHDLVSVRCEAPAFTLIQLTVVNNSTHPIEVGIRVKQIVQSHVIFFNGSSIRLTKTRKQSECMIQSSRKFVWFTA